MNTCQAPRGRVRSELVPVVSHAVAVPAVPRTQRGFTLLELLVVLVIIGLLAGYVGPQFFKQIGKSETKTAAAQIDGLGKALDQYRLDTGHYPSTEQGLAVLVTKPSDEPRWAGPYLSKALPQDPWRNDYQYRSPGVAWGRSSSRAPNR